MFNLFTKSLYIRGQKLPIFRNIDILRKCSYDYFGQLNVTSMISGISKIKKIVKINTWQ